MPLFKYEAMTNGGKKVQDKVNVDTKQEVVDIVKEKNMYPLSIVEVVERKEIKVSDLLYRIKAKDLSVFCRQFFTLLNAGSDILSSVNILRQQTENKRMKESLNTIYEDIQKGLTLSEAMRVHKSTYPRILINMIESGEQTGNLTNVLERMTEYFDKENKINGKIKGAMIYPIFLGILSIAIVAFLLTFVMPTFINMFEGQELPGVTKLMLSISHGLTTYWYIIITVLVLITLLLTSYFKTEKGTRFTSSVKLKFPVIKTTTSKMITSRFTRNLSTILSSGVGIISAIEIVSTVIGNKVVEEELINARDEVIKGALLADVIKNIKAFPPMLIAMVKIGEESGQLDEILSKTADYYDQELEEALAKMVTLIEPIMIMIMGLVVGFIVISMMLPMFSMYSAI